MSPRLATEALEGVAAQLVITAPRRDLNTVQGQRDVLIECMVTELLERRAADVPTDASLQPDQIRALLEASGKEASFSGPAEWRVAMVKLLTFLCEPHLQGGGKPVASDGQRPARAWLSWWDAPDCPVLLTDNPKVAASKGFNAGYLAGLKARTDA